jgi:hypothetical protein
MSTSTKPAALKWNKLSASKSEPMWMTSDERFLVMAFRARLGHKGSRFYDYEYVAMDRKKASEGKNHTEIARVSTFAKAKAAVAAYLADPAKSAL